MDESFGMLLLPKWWIAHAGFFCLASYKLLLPPTVPGCMDDP